MKRITKSSLHKILYDYYNFTQYKYNNDGKRYRKEFIDQLLEEYKVSMNFEYYFKDKFCYVLEGYLYSKDKYFLYMLGLAIELEDIFHFDFDQTLELYTTLVEEGNLYG